VKPGWDYGCRVAYKPEYSVLDLVNHTFLKYWSMKKGNFRFQKDHRGLLPGALKIFLNVAKQAGCRITDRMVLRIIKSNKIHWDSHKILFDNLYEITGFKEVEEAKKNVETTHSSRIVPFGSNACYK
jgi:hypothetical protein